MKPRDTGWGTLHRPVRCDALKVVPAPFSVSDARLADRSRGCWLSGTAIAGVPGTLWETRVNTTSPLAGRSSGEAGTGQGPGLTSVASVPVGGSQSLRCTGLRDSSGAKKRGTTVNSGRGGGGGSRHLSGDEPDFQPCGPPPPEGVVPDVSQRLWALISSPEQGFHYLPFEALHESSGGVNG